MRSHLFSTRLSVRRSVRRSCVGWGGVIRPGSGPAKSQLVHEIDALGGEMGKMADRCYLQRRVLNRSKGPAVWALRAQTDKKEYCEVMRKVRVCFPLPQGAGQRRCRHCTRRSSKPYRLGGYRCHQVSSRLDRSIGSIREDGAG